MENDMTIINENQKGLLFKNGKFIKVLESGKYSKLFGKTIQVCAINDEIVSTFTTIDFLLKNKNFAEKAIIIDIKANEIALHLINGIYTQVLSAGKHTFWKSDSIHEFMVIDISTPKVADDFPVHFFNQIPNNYYEKVSVQKHEKAILFFDNKLQTVLDSGVYYFWKNSIDVHTIIVDTRLTQINITGQEILTLDKVSLRINLVGNYRIKDFINAFTEVDNYIEQIHVLAQLALREFVGKHKVDEILENKDKISEYVFNKLKENEQKFFVEFESAGVKDIILPGEIRDIMNAVLIAEKQAQANVISRREEVASTRSMLNTAKLLDENKTLRRLKELEYIERISANVGNISLSSGEGLIKQLGKALIDGGNED